LQTHGLCDLGWAGSQALKEMNHEDYLRKGANLQLHLIYQDNLKSEITQIRGSHECYLAEITEK
jgi:hypothetical protein